jgi:hypothetical protein
MLDLHLTHRQPIAQKVARGEEDDDDEDDRTHPKPKAACLLSISHLPNQSQYI